MANFDLFEKLNNFFNETTTVKSAEAQQATVIIPLGIKPPDIGNNNVMVFLGDENGGGKIAEMSSIIVVMNEGNNAVDLSSMSKNGITQYQELAAKSGIDAMRSNFITYEAGANASLPFDPSKPENATVENLPQIKTALENIRADLINSADDPDARYEVVERVREEMAQAVALPHDDPNKIQAVETALDKIKALEGGVIEKQIEVVDNALGAVNIAINLPEYREELRNDLDNSDLDKSSLGNEIINTIYSDTPEAMESPTAGDPNMVMMQQIR